MTAGEIISEIEQLPPVEQAGVISFVRDLTSSSRLGAPELTELATDLANAPHAAEAHILKERIVAGFYGCATL
jgi:hypothetical protein